MKLLSLITILFSAHLGFAATNTKAVTKTTEAKAEAAKAANADAMAGKKTTEVSFEDVLVQGKYHFSDEAVTTVEQDKVLDSLLGVRKDFKDRIRKSVSQQ